MHGVTFKKRAPRAIKEIKEFAYKAMVRAATNTNPIWRNWSYGDDIGVGDTAWSV